MGRKLAAIGTVLSVIYFVVLALLFRGRTYDLLALPLNELGDFLAGAFGPIAVLWLVLGFFQQGQELRYSREALLLQASELKQSVEQQRALVEVSREQVTAERERLREERQAAERAADARFTFRGIGSTTSGPTTVFQTHIANSGATATMVAVASTPPLDYQTQREIPIFATGTEFPFDFRFSPGHPAHGDRITISYRNAFGHKRAVEFEYLTANGALSAIVPHEG